MQNRTLSHPIYIHYTAVHMDKNVLSIFQYNTIQKNTMTNSILKIYKNSWINLSQKSQHKIWITKGDLYWIVLLEFLIFWPLCEFYTSAHPPWVQLPTTTGFSAKSFQPSPISRQLTLFLLSCHYHTLAVMFNRAVDPTVCILYRNIM